MKTMIHPLPHPLPRSVILDAGADMSWKEYELAAEAAAVCFKKHYQEKSFNYCHPVHLQCGSEERFKAAYQVKTGYLAWGDASNPLVICLGGIANVAHRFNALSMALQDNYYIVCPDWVGRGNSGWMRDQSDYGFDTYVEQVRQLMVHLGERPAIVLGSSLGGSVALELAQAWPGQVRRLILNDIGPFMPSERRTRRAATLARHYVFKSPADILRKTGAAQKNDGPVPSTMRILISHEQTQWCAANGGRIYRYDIRAMQQYQVQANADVNQWAQWAGVTCPVLLIHGMESDALAPETIQRMQDRQDVTVMHIPDTGHTPALGEANHIWFIHQWMVGNPMLAAEFCAPYSSRVPDTARA